MITGVMATPEESAPDAGPPPEPADDQAKPGNWKRGGKKLTMMSVAHLRFCEHYFEHGNASEAYRLHIASSPDTPHAYTGAKRLLKHPVIQKMLKMLKEEAFRAARATAGRIVSEAERIAFTDLRTLFKPNGDIKNPSTWNRSLQALVSGVKVTKVYGKVTDDNGRARKKVVGRSYEVKIVNRLQALELLAKCRGMFAVEDLAAEQDRSHPPLVIGGEAKPETL